MPEPLLASCQLRDALCQAGITFVHWKSNSHLAEALAGLTDIDLFLRAHHKPAFAQVMEKVGAIRILSQPWASYPDVEDWLVCDAATRKFLHLHVHYKLLTGLRGVKHLHLPWEEVLLANLRKDPVNKWPVPTAEMELLTLLVRMWAKMPPWRRLLKPKLPRCLRDEFGLLLRETRPSAVTSVANKLVLEIDAATLQQLFDGPTDGTIIALSRQLYDQMRSHYRMNWSQSLLHAGRLNTQALFSRIWLKIVGPIRCGKTLSREGVMIAIIGADGSGKSTLCQELAKWLRFKLDVHQLYMGSGNGGGWLQAIRRHVTATLRSRKGKRKALNKGGDRVSSVWEKLYHLLDLHLMRRKLRMLRLGRKMADGGSIILLDRYPQGQVNGISDGPRLQNGRGFNWAAEAERRLYEEAAGIGPDMLIRLRVEPGTAQLRKPDHEIHAIALKCQIIDDLDFPQSKVINIDANEAYSSVLMNAKHAVWQFLTKQPP
jgi:thymidylate kinase